MKVACSNGQSINWSTFAIFVTPFYETLDIHEIYTFHCDSSGFTQACEVSDMCWIQMER